MMVEIIKIVLVDDMEIARKAIKSKLYQYKQIKILFECSNGKDLLSHLDTLSIENFPDIVLIDLEMPILDGIQTISIGSLKYPSLKFIVLTVFDSSEKLFQAIQAGARGYLLKDDNAIGLKDSLIQVAKFDSVPMSPSIARKTLSMLRSIPDKQKEKIPDEILSHREQEVLLSIIEGMDYKAIAEKLFISPTTVRTHISNIYEKLHVNSKAQAIAVAHKFGWI